jgi:hypothetical protein
VRRQVVAVFAIAKSNRNTSKKILGTRKKPAEIYLCVIGPVAEENGMRIGIVGAGEVGDGLGKLWVRAGAETPVDRLLVPRSRQKGRC